MKAPETLRCPPGWDWVFSSDPEKDTPPPGLQHYCRSTGQEKDSKLQLRKFERIVRDCRIVGPAGNTLFPRQKLYEALNERFLQEARGVVPQTMPASSGQVRLEVIDSVQDGDSEPGECTPDPTTGDLECSPHGKVLVDLMPGLQSGAQVATRRALAWTHRIRPADQPSEEEEELEIEDPAGETQGGSSGTAYDLATAIQRAVKEWTDEGGGSNLILNLSVGWEEINDPMGELGEVVQPAVRYAVCSGALVIAAAGNRVSGPPADVNKPLFPAAWEKVAAPTPQQCVAEFPGLPLPDPPNATYTPLVFAVGGVQQDSRPLSNSRSGATPRLVAFGDHAPVGSGAKLKILTGTSVSTLVVSAAAAKLWRHNPQYTAFQVMEELWGNSQLTQLDVDFCLDQSQDCQPGQPAKRVFVHGHPPSTRPDWPGGQPPLDPLVTPSVTAQINLAVQAQCNAQPLNAAVTPGSGAQSCPQNVSDIRSQPWLGPQPDANHNPACRYSENSPGTLYLEFDPCFRVKGKPATISDLTLLVGDKAYRLPVDSFTLGDPSQPCSPDSDPQLVQIVIEDLNFEDDPPHPMYLAVTVNGKHATISPLLQVFGQDD